MDMLEKFSKKFLKMILLLPVTTANPAVYIISGTLPIDCALLSSVQTLQRFAIQILSTSFKGFLYGRTSLM